MKEETLSEKRKSITINKLELTIDGAIPKETIITYHYPEEDVKEFVQWCLKWKSKNIETKEDDFLVIPMKKFKKRAGGDLITNIKENGTKINT